MYIHMHICIYICIYVFTYAYMYTMDIMGQDLLYPLVNFHIMNWRITIFHKTTHSCYGHVEELREMTRGYFQFCSITNGNFRNLNGRYLPHTRPM